MNKQYTNIHDLDKEILAVGVFELIPHVLGLNPKYIEALMDPVEGLYLPGSIEPVFAKDTIYTVSTGHHSQAPTAVDWGVILRDALGEKTLPPGSFYNEDVGPWFDRRPDGIRVFMAPKPYMRRSLYEHIKRHFTTEPRVPARGCEAAIATIVSYLNSLNENTFVPTKHYDLGSLVKPEYHYLIEKESYETAFHKLWKEVNDWIGKDTWNIYRYYLKGMVLVIEKGMDFRILDWHRNQIMQMEGYDETYGEVVRIHDEPNSRAA